MADDAVSRIDESDKKRNKGDFCVWKLGKEGESCNFCSIEGATATGTVLVVTGGTVAGDFCGMDTFRVVTSNRSVPKVDVGVIDWGCIAFETEDFCNNSGFKITILLEEESFKWELLGVGLKDNNWTIGFFWKNEFNLIYPSYKKVLKLYLG